MVPPRTSEELKAAVDSMFRIRAVESPPDATGMRSVWHRGSKGADLLSEVNGQGALVHQEFVLFGDMLVWDRDAGVRTGEAQSLVLGSGIKPSDTVHWDGEAAAGDQRLQRMLVALQEYQGEDRYLQHLRKVVLMAGKGELHDLADADEITLGQGTRSPVIMTPPASPAYTTPAAVAQPPEEPRSLAPTVALIVGALLVVAALVLLLLK